SRVATRLRPGQCIIVVGPQSDCKSAESAEDPRPAISGPLLPRHGLRILTQASTQWPQMYTPGPPISRSTSRSDLRQNEQNKEPRVFRSTPIPPSKSVKLTLTKIHCKVCIDSPRN